MQLDGICVPYQLAKTAAAALLPDAWKTQLQLVASLDAPGIYEAAVT